MSAYSTIWVNDGQHDLEIARFVIEGDPFINHLVAQAAEELRILTFYEHWGFATAVQDGDPDVLKNAIAALYLHLMGDHRLFYEYELAFNMATGEQRIQLPSVTILEKKGTCVDLTLLFLSALAQAKLEPVYVQLKRPGACHALAAAWIDPALPRSEMLTIDEVREALKDNRLVVVECTGFVRGYPSRQHQLLFRQAQDEARTLVNDPSWNGWAVDVRRVWQSKRISPLPPPELPSGSSWTMPLASTPNPQLFRSTIHPFAAHIKEKTRGFVGRQWIFDEVDKHIQDRERFPSGYILITGEPGIGKSAIAAQLVKDRGYLHHFNIKADNICSPKAFLNNVCAQLIMRSRLPYDRLPEDVDKDSQFVSRLLQEARERIEQATPLVLVIDALDEAERSGAANPLFLPFSLPDGVFVVATTRPGGDYPLSAARVRTVLLDGRRSENQADAREFVDAHRKKLGMQDWMAKHAIEPGEFIDLLVEKSQGNFMYLYHVLMDMEQNKLLNLTPAELPPVFPTDKNFEGYINLASLSRRSEFDLNHATSSFDELHVPAFHLGSVVPPEYFISRESQIEHAESLLGGKHSFLIVGKRRAGKTSLSKNLITRIKQRNTTIDNSRTVVCYFNLERDIKGTPTTFLEHTMINMICETWRQVFGGQFVQLERDTPSAFAGPVEHAFQLLQAMYRRIIQSSIYRQGRNTVTLIPDDFIEYTEDLLNLIRSKGWSNFILFYDEANHLPRELAVGLLLDNADALSADNVTTVYAASPEMADSFEPLHRHYDHQILLGPFDSERDMLRLAAMYYYKDASRTRDLPITERAIRRIWQYSSGQPYQIQCLLWQSFSNARRSHSNAVTDTQVEDAHRDLIKKRPEYFSVNSAENSPAK